MVQAKMRVRDEDIGRHRRQSRHSGENKRSFIWVILFVALVVAVIYVYVNRHSIVPGLTDAIPQEDIAAEQDESPSVAKQPQSSKSTDTLQLITPEIEDLRIAVNAISGDIEKLKSQIGFLDGANTRDNAQFKKINDQFQGINSQFPKINNQLQKIANKLEEIDTKSQAQTARQNEFNSIVSENIDALRKSINNLDNIYRNQGTALEDLEAGMANINSRVTDLER